MREVGVSEADLKNELVELECAKENVWKRKS